MNKDKKIITGVIVLFFIVVGVGLYFTTYEEQLFPPEEEMIQGISYAPQAVSQADNSEDLGASIYKQSNNPLSNKLPETVAPVANPLEDIYKNPF